MNSSNPLAALVLSVALLTPALAAAQQAPRLSLNPADANHDGIVSDLEHADQLASAPAEVTPVLAPRGERPLVTFDRDPQPSPPGPLDLERRIVPASEFEIAQEHRFQKAWDKAH
jgi:hypothetical protein